VSRIQDLDTPALVIDVETMERNLARAAAYAQRHGLRLRPHTKTHKIPALGRRQIELGAAGLTVAKTTEGEVMLASGTPDLLIAYPVVGAAKLARLIELARRVQVTVALDDARVAALISGAAARAGVEIGILAEADLGLLRVGVTPGPALLDLVKNVLALPALRWRGVAFYPGHIKDHAAESLGALERLRHRRVIRQRDVDQDLRRRRLAAVIEQQEIRQREWLGRILDHHQRLLAVEGGPTVEGARRPDEVIAPRQGIEIGDRISWAIADLQIGEAGVIMRGIGADQEGDRLGRQEAAHGLHDPGIP